MEETKEEILKDEATGLEYKIITVPDMSKVTADTKTIEQVPTKDVKLFDSIVPQRLDSETHEEFRIRRKYNNVVIRKHLKGRMFWNTMFMGTLENERLKQRLEELKKEKANG